MRFEYSVRGNKVTLESDDDLVAVRFQAGIPRSAKAVIAMAAQTSYSARVDLLNEAFSIFRVPPSAAPRPQRISTASAKLLGSGGVLRTAPVFRVPGGRAVATDRVIVRLNDDLDEGAWLTEGTDRVTRRVRTGGSVLVVRLQPEEDPLLISNQWAQDARVAWSEPDFVTLWDRRPRRVEKDRGDPLADRQYALRLLQVSQAWEVQRGHPDVVVAILDEGVDSAHEDLRDAVRSSFDAIDGDAYQEPNPWDGHGTACAGLAIATSGNGRGVRGVAAGCKAFAVRIAQAPYPRAGWQTTNEIIASGIGWAWRNGASVLSNSWGGGAESNLVLDEVEAARTLGRDGRGCVVVFAAGNDDRAVEYPANTPGVLAVSASNEYDEPKTPRSRDGEEWWGSCFGPEVWVAAYVSNFNGTSSATPLVAGVAALVLSVAPNLSEAEVREIIAATADKVGPIPFVDGRNDRMGYGRVNALRAVQEAKRRA